MNLLLPIASLLGLEVDDLLDRLKKNAIAWSVIAFFAVVGIIFALVGLHAWLVTEYGPIWAPLIIAGVALVIALGIYAVMRIMEIIVHRKQAERRRSTQTTALVTTAAVTALPMLMRSPLMKSVGIPVGGALAALYLLSRPGRKHTPDED